MPKTRSFDLAPLPFEVTVALLSIGRRIAEARKARGYNQKIFADMLGVASATLVSMEKGAPTVQIGHYARALWMLEIHDTFLGGFGIPAITLQASEGAQ